MRKKQLFKLGNGKKSKVIGGAMLSMAMGVMIAGGTLMAGNIQDKPYSFYSTSGGSTPEEDKLDDSSAYIRHDGNVDVNVQVKNNNVNYTAGGGSYYVRVGTSRYLANYINELGMNKCYLFLRQAGSGAYALYGVWSPDSV